MDLKTLRNRAGYTQHTLADKLDIHYTVVSKWERGVQPVPGKYHQRLADLLGVQPRAIATMGEPQMPDDDSYRSWITDVISSDLDPISKVILIAMVSIVDAETDVCVATFDELAETAKITTEDVSSRWAEISKSGFIRTLGMEAVAKIIK